jgi:GT2 family glycosyltransferase
MIQHPSCFVSKKIYDQFGMFDTQYKYSSDYDFMIRMKKNGVKFYFIEKVLASFKEGGISNSVNAKNESNLIKYRHGFISYKILILSKLLGFLKLFFKRVEV